MSLCLSEGQSQVIGLDDHISMFPGTSQVTIQAVHAPDTRFITLTSGVPLPAVVKYVMSHYVLVL